MNILLLTVAAILSVCSGQGSSRYFNPRRRPTGFRQPSMDPAYDVVLPTRRRQVMGSGSPFGGRTNFDSVDIMPLGGRRGGILDGRMSGDMGMRAMIASPRRIATNRGRVNTRRVVDNTPFRRITRRISGTRDEMPIREGYIGARGGQGGFPIWGGYCAGEACKDGGETVGVGNGYGPGSLQNFLRRRRLGQNEDIRLYERFAGGPNGNARQRRQ